MHSPIRLKEEELIQQIQTRKQETGVQLFLELIQLQVDKCQSKLSTHPTADLPQLQAEVRTLDSLLSQINRKPLPRNA